MFNLSLFLTYTVMMLFTPGPNNLLSLYNASQNGMKKNMSYIFGVTIGFFIVMALASSLNYWLNSALTSYELFIKIIGAVYMIYLGIKILKRKKNTEESYEGKIIDFKTGLLMQFLNPKTILYGITLFSVFVTPYFDSISTLLLFSVVVSLLMLTSVSLWAMLGNYFSKFLNKYQLYLDYLMSAFLFYVAYSLF